MSDGKISDNDCNEVEAAIKKYIDEASRIIKKQINENVGCEEEIKDLLKLYDSLDEESKYYVDEQVLRLQIWLRAVTQLEKVEKVEKVEGV